MKAKRFFHALAAKATGKATGRRVSGNGRALLGISLMLAATLGLMASCTENDDNPVTPQPSDNLPAVAAKVQGAEKLLTKTDYSLTDNWLAKPATADKAVDVFYLYPTAYNTTDAAQDRVCDIDDATMHTEAQRLLRIQASAFVTDQCNLYAPYYRQTDALFMTTLTQQEVDEWSEFESTTDPTTALDYYFEHLNQGRPFILCGHSQGSMNLLYLLRDYFKNRKDRYQRMIAAYIIGYSVTRDYLQSAPHLKFATGPTDTGVIVSWNTEGPENSDAYNFVVRQGAVSINPLNWRTDDTYAPVTANLGSLPMATGELTEGLADAQLNVERGVVVTTADKRYAVPERMSAMFGPRSFHGNDIGFYYMNIRQNVEQRISAYLDK
ncbi:MAG: DUF3089 domain-containing protein [Bacteroidaceae bacterium]|nr:DUF3089 domain-containing protein [Bacteroidaceae bacterium]